jgi:hypothetical protein
VYVRLAANATAGSKSGAITLTSSGAADATVAMESSTVAAKPLTGSFTAANKLYDGTAAATVTGRFLTGVVGSDAVSLSGGTAAFADAAVGAGKTVTLTGATLSGAQAANYTLGPVATTTADITAAIDGFTTWLDGQPTNAQALYKYAVGGATNVNAASEAVEGSLQGERVSLTAVVRTNDPKLVVTGEASAELQAWGTNGVSNAAAPAQSDVSPGFQRRIFSIEATNNQPSLFLRLRALYAP